MVGGGHMDFRLRSFAVSVARPSAPTVPQSRGTGGGCHSAVGPSHREICQPFWNGDTPSLFGPENAT